MGAVFFFDYFESVTILLEEPVDLGATLTGLLVIPSGPRSVRLPLELHRDGFLQFCRQYPKLRAELDADGTVEVTAPLSLACAGYKGVAFLELGLWWHQHRIGNVFTGNVGFALPDGSVRAPDAAWVSPERLSALDPKEFDHFARVVPDFIIEVRSKSDRLGKLQEKMREVWLPAGVLLAWLIDPKQRKAYIYRPGEEVVVVDDFSQHLVAGELVPDFELNLAEFQ